MDPRGAAHAHQQHQGLVRAPHHHQQPPHPHPIPASTIHQQPPITYGPEPHSDAHAAASHPHPGTTTSQEPQGPHGAHTQHPHDPQGRPDPQPAQHPPPPPPPPSTERPFGCGALWAPSSTRAVAPQPVQPAPVAPRAGKHSLRPVPPHLPKVRPRPWEPDPARVAAPPVPKAVKECGSDPSRATYHRLLVPTGSRGVVG